MNERKNIRVFQTYYNSATFDKLDAIFCNYRSTRCNRFFESQIICDIFDQDLDKGSDYCGVVGTSIRNKVRGWPFDFRRRMADDNFIHDCYFFKTGIAPPWHQGEYHHGAGFVDAAQAACRRAGLSLDLIALAEICPPIYSNFQVCRTALYRQYVDTVLRPFITRAFDAPELDRNANYRDGRLSPEELLQICGQPYYTLHAFVAERLFPTFVAAHRLSCAVLQP